MVLQLMQLFCFRTKAEFFHGGQGGHCRGGRRNVPIKTKERIFSLGIGIRESAGKGMFPADTQMEGVGCVHKKGLGSLYNGCGGHVSGSQQKEHDFSRVIRIG